MGVRRLKHKVSAVLAGIAAALGVFTLWRLVAAPEPRPEWLVHASAYPALSPEDLEGETPEGRARRERTHALLTKPEWSAEDVDYLLGSLASGVPDATFEQPQDRSKVLAVLAFDEPLDAIRIRLRYSGALSPSHRDRIITALLALTAHRHWYVRQQAGVALIDGRLMNNPECVKAVQRLLKDPDDRVVSIVAGVLRREKR